MSKFSVTAPTRADLAGGTLDIWPLYCLVGGAKTINLAIDLTSTVEFEIKPVSGLSPLIELRAGDDICRLSDLDFQESELRAAPPSLQFPAFIVREYLRLRGQQLDGDVNIRISGRAPLRSGLGGSSTMCVALVRGLGALFQDFVQLGWQWELMSWVRDVEASFMKAMTGTQDYLAALFGGLNCYQSRVGKIDLVGYPAGVFDQLAERAVLIFSGEMHHSGMTNWELIKRAIGGEPSIVKGLDDIRQCADQLDQELRGHLSWKHVGQYLTEEWNIRRATFDVHTPRLDEILQFLLKQHVHGAKVCGAASGGSILALIEPSRKQDLIQACSQHGIHVLKTLPTSTPVTLHRHS